MRLIKLVAAACALICILAPAAHAEYAVLRDGTRLHITGYETVGTTLRLHVPGGSVDMPAENVLRIEPEEVFAAVPKSCMPEAPLNVPYADLIRAAATKYDLDPQLVASVVKTESNFNPRAISVKNAQGLMQLMPQTSSELAVKHPFDPAENIDAGSRYLRQLLDQFSGNLTLALAAYNAGPTRVTQAGGVPAFRETQNYVTRVTKNLKQTKDPHALDAATIAALFVNAKTPDPPR